MPNRLTWPLILCLSAPPAPPPEAPPRWPDASAPLTVAKVAFPKGFGKKRIYLDAGHGAPGNQGNTSVSCEPEEAHTLRVAQEFAKRLEATGHCSRPDPDDYRGPGAGRVGGGLVVTRNAVTLARSLIPGPVATEATTSTRPVIAKYPKAQGKSTRLPLFR